MNRRKKRILVVDDDPDLVDLLTLLLRADYEVVSALDGAEALARIRAEHFDAVVLDLVIPLVDGALLKRTMDVLGSHVPVIILSATTDVASTARDLGAAGHLRKPFDPEDVTTTVARVVGAGREQPRGGRSVAP